MVGEVTDILLNLLVDTGDDLGKVLPYPIKEYKNLKAIDKIPIGNTSPDLDGEDIIIDMSTACRIAFVASTRGGKSYFMTEIASHCYQSGYMLAITNDNKNEWSFARNRTPPKFRRKTHPNFDIVPMPIVPLMPTFLWDIKKFDREDFIPIQFDLSQINQKDLVTIMGFNNIFAKDQFVNALRLIWAKYNSIGLSKITFEKFYSDIENKEKFDNLTGKMYGNSTRRSLLSRLIPLKMANVFGSKNKIDLKELMLENKVPSLCIEGSDKVDIGLIYTYLAILQRNLRIHKIENPILRKRRLILINDETSFIAPENGFPSSKFEALENNQRGAYYGIYQFFGIQDTSTVDPTIISQCKYIFISAFTSGTDVRRVCKIMNLPEKTREYIQENIHMLKPRGDGQRGWFMIEKGMDGFPIIVYPYAPSCGFSSKTFK